MPIKEIEALSDAITNLESQEFYIDDSKGRQILIALRKLLNKLTKRELKKLEN
jgi:TnpA family transposase